jgi:hypothetical protein
MRQCLLLRRLSSLDRLRTERSTATGFESFPDHRGSRLGAFARYDLPIIVEAGRRSRWSLIRVNSECFTMIPIDCRIDTMRGLEGTQRAGSAADAGFSPEVAVTRWNAMAD